MARRNSFDINADILRIAEGGSRVTRLAYGANLNFGVLKKYLSQLVEARLIFLKNGVYTTTSYGQEYLLTYDDLSNLASPDTHPQLAV